MWETKENTLKQSRFVQIEINFALGKNGDYKLVGLGGNSTVIRQASNGQAGGQATVRHNFCNA